MAPYFYTQLWILDAKTLTVLDTEERYDYQKIYDWRWTANDVQRNFSPEQMADTVQAFVERSAARATREAVGTVTVGEPKLVNPRQEMTRRVLNVGGHSKAIALPAHYEGWEHHLLDIERPIHARPSDATPSAPAHETEARRKSCSPIPAAWIPRSS